MYIIGTKVSNGYSKLANYQLGGSGFQIKPRNRSSRHKKNKKFNHKRETETDIHSKRDTKNHKSREPGVREVSNPDIRPKNVTEALWGFPKRLWGNIFSRLINVSEYGQLHSSNDQNLSRETVIEGPNRISVLNQDASNGAARGKLEDDHCIKFVNFIKRRYSYLCHIPLF